MVMKKERRSGLHVRHLFDRRRADLLSKSGSQYSLDRRDDGPAVLADGRRQQGARIPVYDMKPDEHRDIAGIERVRRDDESQERLSGSGDHRAVAPDLSTLHNARACQDRYEARSSASALSTAESSA